MSSSRRGEGENHKSDISKVINLSSSEEVDFYPSDMSMKQLLLMDD